MSLSERLIKGVVVVLASIDFMLDAETVDEFVKRSDALGGPTTLACQQFWGSLQYKPSVDLSHQVDPLSRDYFAQQFDLYQEITGKFYSETEDEFTPNVPVTDLLAAPNAYGFMAPADFAKHCVAMGALVQRLQPAMNDSVLELGSGWGFCQEFLATCGLQSVGIDANPDFVRSSNARLSRLGFGERARLLQFTELDGSLGQFDVLLAYEAFHHAVDPLALLRAGKQCLKPTGKVVLAAEPFNDFYVSWGLRLDPYSVYCIRKFGWFESGWSALYMSFLFACVGLQSEFVDLGLSELSRYMIGTQSGWVHASQLGLWHPEVRESVTQEGDALFLNEESRLFIPAGSQGSEACVLVENYSGRTLRLASTIGGCSNEHVIGPGSSDLVLSLAAGGTDLPYHVVKLSGETFCPKDEGINDDTRTLGIRVRGLKV